MEYIASILAYLGKSFWFYLPAFAANLAVFLVYARHGISFPLDLGKKWGGKRLIGDGRSLSGYILMFFVSIFIAILQGRNAVEGLYFGAGTNFGCILNSFIKRRLNLERGEHIFLLDETDYILGASLFYISFSGLSLNVFFLGLLWAMMLNTLSNVIFRRKTLSIFAKDEKVRSINK